MIVRALVTNNPANNVDLRVTAVRQPGAVCGALFVLTAAKQVVSNNAFLSDYASNVPSSSYQILTCAAGRRSNSSATTLHDAVSNSAGVKSVNSRGLMADENAGAYLPHPELGFYQTWSYKYCEVDPGCCGFRVSSVVSPQMFSYYTVKPDHSNYNLRVATFTVDDNIDMYTRRDDDGGGRPDTTSYHATSVRESVPWAIDEDPSGFECTTDYMGISALAVNTTVSATDPYASALSLPSLGGGVTPSTPNCVPWTVGIMGDNKYPQTVGASEYSARVFLEFNFADFACDDSGVPEGSTGIVNDTSRRGKCVTSGLRFVRDADVVRNNNVDGQSWVVRLTEAKQRVAGVYRKWSDQQNMPSYPAAQRSGAVWWHRKQHLADGFETNFVFQVTDPSQCGGADKICDGADGFAFVITNDARVENADMRSNAGWNCSALGCDLGGSYSSGTDAYPPGLIGCPADGLGYANSKKSSTVNYFGEWQECTLGLRKALAVEFDLFYNVERCGQRRRRLSTRCAAASSRAVAPGTQA